ncbi:hypothetical protein RclHR1_01480010 [Rhizophagus clarus]|uniref:BTB domain-containing protein n=1 Tax=Rhizophagus clarus TaxID=94130 RepID=A0A2Z6QFD4_9GLOM|nr:hypothetical protein RclHR1_01480010 [Rhizophagus clarus]GET00885.1 hypothetical protein GLOIN_2v1765555 [Rhizophagus clarus]
MALQFLPHLSQDFTKLLENKKKHDVIINVDKSDNEKKICAHSIVLETRSAYFENAFSNEQTKKENNIFILELPDISSDIFNILIRYIYGGIIDLDNMEASDILNLLNSCEKFKLKELYDYVQDYLIEHHKAWLFQNLILVQQVCFKHSDFTKLQNYWTTTICEQPEILFNANDFTSVGKEALLSICKDESLYMEENELWDHVIRWGKAQNTELPEEVNDWSPSDFNALKKSLENFIPCIRFYDFTSDDFCFKITPYSGIFPNDLYQDLLKYNLVSEWQPKFNILTSRKANLNIPNITIDSKLINGEQAALISSWIQGNNESKISNKFRKVYYEFKLLTRGSRDGFTGAIFHKMCDNKGPTITVIRLKDESSILGGYNPINWDVSKGGKYEKITDSFIFNLDNKEIILSRIQNYDNAINQYGGGPNFNDLQLTWTFNVDNGATYNKKAYNKKIHNEGSFIVSEYEVFGVARIRQ